MTKITILQGKYSEQFEKARSILTELNLNKTVVVKAKNVDKNDFAFMECTKETDSIIIEDLDNTHDFQYMVCSLFSEVVVNKQSMDPFSIKPKIIITTKEKISGDLGFSMLRRIELVKLK